MALSSAPSEWSVNYHPVTTLPPCSSNPELFTTPKTDTAPDAITVCQQCPRIRECAVDAMTSGTTLDTGLRGPADDVIQAGVWCRGDQPTLEALAAVAGVTPPRFGTRPRYTPPHICKGCGGEMTTRKKGHPTQPHVLTHAAHGYCRICDARRRRQKDWVSPQPKHSTLFDWKEKRYGHHRHTGNSGPGRGRHNGTGPNTRKG